jgi:hypothetical protein
MDLGSNEHDYGRVNYRDEGYLPRHFPFFDDDSNAPKLVGGHADRRYCVTMKAFRNRYAEDE